MTKLNLAVVQAAPIPLDVAAGIDKAVRLAREAFPGAVLNRGGSLIAAPDTRMIAQAGEGKETLLANLDIDGHRARPDVCELHFDIPAKNGLMWNG